MLNFLTESSRDFKETETVGSFSANSNKNSFDTVYENAHENFMQQSIDPMVDINLMIRNDTLMESYKDALLSSLKEDCENFEAIPDASRYASLYEQVSTMFDNCRDDLVTESTRVGNLLPIKAVDFPILIKQNLAIASKDIIQTEVTKSPIIKKHIERRYIVIETDPDESGKTETKYFEYPQCFFKKEFKEIYNAGKGWPIKETPVDMSELFNYPIIEKLTDAPDPGREKFTYNIKITKVIADSKEIPVNMYVNLADGNWLGGTIKDPDSGEIIDVVTGIADFMNHTVTLSSASGKVTQVVFTGYLSNDLNERTVTFDRKREELEWKIEDGFRADVPYSLEELEDAKALMNMDLYKLTYNDLADLLVQMEDSNILEYLDAEYDKWNGVEVDPLDFTSFIREQTFDCDAKTQTVALQVEYIQKMLKFYIDRFVIDICDTAKIENMTFVIYGNPRYISLLDPEVNWVVKSGSFVGGVKLNYSYGIMNAGGLKIQVVSTMKYDSNDKRKLRFIPYPLSNDQFTFKHYKYTTHILTGQNSGYRSAKRPGGSATYLMGTTRNTTASIQGIQGSISFKNTPFILEK